MHNLDVTDRFLRGRGFKASVVPAVPYRENSQLSWKNARGQGFPVAVVAVLCLPDA